MVCQPKQVLTEWSLDWIVCRLNGRQTELSTDWAGMAIKTLHIDAKVLKLSNWSAE